MNLIKTESLILPTFTVWGACGHLYKLSRFSNNILYTIAVSIEYFIDLTIAYDWIEQTFEKKKRMYELPGFNETKEIGTKIFLK